MSEIVNTYNLDWIHWLIPMERGSFYKKQLLDHENWKAPSIAVEDINIILFTKSGEMILQKRSSHKSHNPNLIDKSIGWHIVHWDSADYTAMIESVQELKVPSVVLRNHDDFIKTLNTLKMYLSSTAVIQYVDTKVNKNKKLINGEKVTIFNKTHLYIWIYWWSVKNVDREAKWILFYEIDELLEEMKDFPQNFTNDLHRILKEYRSVFEDFVSEVSWVIEN